MGFAEEAAGGLATGWWVEPPAPSNEGFLGLNDQPPLVFLLGLVCARLGGHTGEQAGVVPVL